MICLMVGFVPLTTVAAAADIMFLLLFLQVNIAVITIRKKYGTKLAYGYLTPFFPIVPILSIVMQFGLALFMFHHYPSAWFYVIAWLTGGFLIFRFYASGREREKIAPPILAQQRGLEVRPHSVVVAVANPLAAGPLVKLGSRVALHRNGEVVLLHAVRVPLQLPQRAATRFISAAQTVLKNAAGFAEPFEVPISRVIRTGPDVAQAVVHTVREKNSDFVIMGWKGPRRRRDTQIGRNIDKVLRESNAHAIVMTRVDDDDPVSRVLVPVADAQNAGLAIFVAALLIEGSPKPEIEVLHLSREPLEESGREQFRRLLAGAISEDEEPDLQTGFATDFFRKGSFRLEFRQATDVISEISEYSSGFDRLILGTSRGGFFQRKVFGRIPTQIAERAKCPVILIRPRERGITFEIQKFFQFFRELEEE